MDIVVTRGEITNILNELFNPLTYNIQHVNMSCVLYTMPTKKDQDMIFSPYVHYNGYPDVILDPNIIISCKFSSLKDQTYIKKTRKMIGDAIINSQLMYYKRQIYKHLTEKEVLYYKSIDTLE